MVVVVVSQRQGLEPVLVSQRQGLETVLVARHGLAPVVRSIAPASGPRSDRIARSYHNFALRPRSP